MKAIEVFGLTKAFKDVVAIDNMSLGIEEGELFALLGVNGAGKSTLINILTGLLKPTSGDALLDGKSIVQNMEQVKKMINISPQETAFAPNLSVKENLEFMVGMYEVKNKDFVVEKLLQDFNLVTVKKKKARLLSGGYKRRLSIAMALVNDPKILFLDEPTLGLDVLARRELWNVILNLKGKKTIILTTHYMEEAENLADRIGIMADGKILDVGSGKDLIKKVGAKNIEDAFVKIVTGGEK